MSNFAAVDRLDLLKKLLGSLYITNEVWTEILNGIEEGYEFYTGIEDQLHPLTEKGWIELVSMTSDEEYQLFLSMPRGIHHGEASCIAIARHRNWAFLSDDKLARTIAQSLGIMVSGTLGILTQAVKRQFLTCEEADKILGEMITRGYRSPYHSLQPLLLDE